MVVVTLVLCVCWRCSNSPKPVLLLRIGRELLLQPGHGVRHYESGLFLVGCAEVAAGSFMISLRPGLGKQQRFVVQT